MRAKFYRFAKKILFFGYAVQMFYTRKDIHMPKNVYSIGNYALKNIYKYHIVAREAAISFLDKPLKPWISSELYCFVLCQYETSLCNRTQYLYDKVITFLNEVKTNLPNMNTKCHLVSEKDWCDYFEFEFKPLRHSLFRTAVVFYSIEMCLCQRIMADCPLQFLEL